MIELTFLKGTEDYYSSAKSFALRSEGIVKTSGYAMGKHFSFETEKIPAKVDEITAVLRRRSAGGWFRINGLPIDFLREIPGAATQRLKDLFPDPISRMKSFDLDGLPVPANISKDWALENPDTTALVIRNILSSMGMSSLAQADFTFLLSSSQFSRDELNCHIYYIFDEPRTEGYMRGVIKAINDASGRKLLDPAVYRSVQPDYITPPVCVGFNDPIPPNARIATSKGINSTVSSVAWNLDINNVAGDGIAQAIKTSGLVVSDPIGSNWLDTVKRYVGSRSKGINDPSFRAAAQLVSEIGADMVKQEIDYYAKQMHDAAWKSIKEKQERGDQKDVVTYNIARFRQYLDSATKSNINIGARVDENSRMVNDAITEASRGKIQEMYSRPVIDSCKILIDSYPQAWAVIENRIKKDLKGLVTVAQVKATIKRFSTVKTEVVGVDRARQEVDNILPLLERYQFIMDDESNMYIKPKGRDEVLPIDGSTADLFFRDAQREGISPSDRFGVKCIKIINAEMNFEDSLSRFTFTKNKVGGRMLRLAADDYAYNIGEGKSVRINPNKLQVSKNEEMGVIWKAGYVPNPITGDTEIRERFGESVIPSPHFWIGALVDGIRKFIAFDNEDIPLIASWLVTAITKEPIAYMLELTGEAGTGKSTAADLLVDLVAPIPGGVDRSAARERMPQAAEGIIGILKNNEITLFDNVREITPPKSDMMCMVATGLSSTERILYTSVYMSTIIKQASIFTGLAPMVTQPDLRSRTISINMTKRPTLVTSLAEDWKKAKPDMLLGLLHLVRESLIELNKPIQTVKGAPRDVLIGVVTEILAKTKTISKTDMCGSIGDTIIHRAESRAYDTIIESNFCSTFIIFLQDCNGVSGTTTQIMNAFNNWIDTKIGTTQTLQMYSGFKVAKEEEVKINREEMSENVRDFGYLLTKYQGSISESSGFTSKQRRTTTGRFREYVKRIDISVVM